MHYHLPHILDMTEGQHFERKSARIAPKDVVKELAGFANASGGIVVIGLEDNGDIAGFHVKGAKMPEEYLEAIRLLPCRPPLKVTDELLPVNNAQGESDHLLILDVQAENNRVVESHDNEVYLRVNDKTVKLSYEDRRKLEFDKGQRWFEDEEVPDSSLEDVDTDIMAQYQARMGIQSFTAEEVLKSRNLLRNGRLTHAGLLLFGKDPSRYLPGARMRFLRFEGKAMQPGLDFNLVKEISITGSIPKMIQRAKDVISAQLREFQYLDIHTGQFQPMPEYPEFAWFEGVVNALTHRDYSIQGDHVRVSMYENRLEIFSPGKLPNIVTLENMKYTRFSRNPKIARVLADFGWVKELNEGVRRIYSEMEKSLLGTPEFREPNGHSVVLVLQNNILNRHVRMTDRMKKMMDSGVLKALSDEEFAVCAQAFGNGRVTVGGVTSLIGRAKPYCSRLLKGLVDMGVLRWRGSNPNDPKQYYEFRSNE